MLECAHCRYDLTSLMRGPEPILCPECGRVTDPSILHRRKVIDRQWLLATLGPPAGCAAYTGLGLVLFLAHRTHYSAAMLMFLPYVVGMGWVVTLVRLLIWIVADKRSLTGREGAMFLLGLFGSPLISIVLASFLMLVTVMASPGSF